jgi:hypothetical protein
MQCNKNFVAFLVACTNEINFADFFLVFTYMSRVLRRISGAKRDEVTVEWRKLHNDELNDLYPSP